MSRGVRLHKAVLSIIVAMLVLLPTSGGASCWIIVEDSAQQPLPEPCDSVLLSYSRVSVSLIQAFDAALVMLSFALPGLMWRAWQRLPTHHVFAHDFSPVPDPPPPRPESAL